MVEQREFGDAVDQKQILRLFGTLEWDDSYDHKSERSRGRRGPRPLPPSADPG
jgi:hypothetical protein